MHPELTEELRTGLTEIKDGITKTDQNITTLTERIQKLQDDHERIDTEFTKLRRLHLAGQSAIRNPQSATTSGGVSDECAADLGARFVLHCAKSGRLEILSQSSATRDALLTSARQILGVESKAALTTADIPLPVG